MFYFIIFNNNRCMKRRYNGCELESPLYRQIAAEMANKKSSKQLITEYKTKRGKHNGRKTR